LAKPTEVTGLGPRVRLGEAAQQFLPARLGDVHHFERRLATSTEPDDVHDMRVATRRLRAALKLVGAPRSLDRKVKRFQDSLGGVRDIHVQLGWMRDAAEGADRDLHRILVIVEAHLKAQLPDRVTALRHELKRWHERTVPAVRSLRATVHDSHRLGGGHFRVQLCARIRRVGDHMKVMARSPDADEAHLLRIEAKKLRYLAELLQPAWPKQLGVLLGMLQPLQESLGRLHDADVRLEQLSALAAALPQNGDGVRRLLERARKERELFAGEAVALVARWRRERVVRGMQRLLSSRAGST
jgi:CHAD domain-containing protein